MKKYLAILLMVVMAFSCVMTVCAEEEPVAVYSFGEIEGELIPGEIINLPVKFTLQDKNVNAIVFQLKFDEDKLEFQKFRTAEGKADHALSGYSAEPTVKDSSVLGISVYSASLSKTQVFDDMELINLKFKVKEEATSGKAVFEIVLSEVSYLLENLEGSSTREFTADEYSVLLEGNKGETENPDEETKDENNGEENSDDEDYEDENSETEDTDDSVTDEKDKDSTKPVTNPSTDEEKEEQTEPAAPDFTDLTGFEWAKDYIVPLAQKGIIRGTGETTFSPANNITRADFMVLLMRLLEIGGTKTDGFADVPSDSYFAAAVTSAKELGIAKGGSDGNFNPYNTITREDMCVLVYRALNSAGYLPVVPDNGTFKTGFSDIDLISDYAYEAMHELYLNGIIGGSDGKVNPKGFATRAETAVIMYRISKLIPEI